MVPPGLTHMSTNSISPQTHISTELPPFSSLFREAPKSSSSFYTFPTVNLNCSSPCPPASCPPARSTVAATTTGTRPCRPGPSCVQMHFCFAWLSTTAPESPAPSSLAGLRGDPGGLARLTGCAELRNRAARSRASLEMCVGGGGGRRK